MEERTSIIEVGDEIEADFDIPARALVETVEVGEYGLLVRGRFPDYGNQPGGWYLPFELPPEELKSPWYNWQGRSSLVLANGVSVGALCWLVKEGWRLEAAESRWLKTLEAMKAEEGVMQSRPTEIRMPG